MLSILSLVLLRVASVKGVVPLGQAVPTETGQQILPRNAESLLLQLSDRLVSVSREDPSSTCGDSCSVRGEIHTCSARIQWVSPKRSLAFALRLVNQQCRGQCACSMDDFPWLQGGINITEPELPCHTAVEGEQCFEAIEWARSHGMRLHPEIYGNLSSGSSIEEFQAWFFQNVLGDCARPCEEACHTAMPGEPCFLEVMAAMRTGAPNDFEQVQTLLNSTGVCPLPCRTCRIAVQGEKCYRGVTWAMQHGIHIHPEWYDGLTSESSFEEFQDLLYQRNWEQCPRPCHSVAGNKTLSTTDVSLPPTSSPSTSAQSTDPMESTTVTVTLVPTALATTVASSEPSSTVPTTTVTSSPEITKISTVMSTSPTPVSSTTMVVDPSVSTLATTQPVSTPASATLDPTSTVAITTQTVPSPTIAVTETSTTEVTPTAGPLTSEPPAVGESSSPHPLSSMVPTVGPLTSEPPTVGESSSPNPLSSTTTGLTASTPIAPLSTTLMPTTPAAPITVKATTSSIPTRTATVSIPSQTTPIPTTSLTAQSTSLSSTAASTSLELTTPATTQTVSTPVSVTPGPTSALASTSQGQSNSSTVTPVLTQTTTPLVLTTAALTTQTVPSQTIAVTEGSTTEATPTAGPLTSEPPAVGESSSPNPLSSMVPTAGPSTSEPPEVGESSSLNPLSSTTRVLTVSTSVPPASTTLVPTTPAAPITVEATTSPIPTRTATVSVPSQTSPSPTVPLTMQSTSLPSTEASTSSELTTRNLTVRGSKSFTNIGVTVDLQQDSDGVTTIMLTGPSSVWFGVGSDAITTEEEPYAIIINCSAGTFEERRLEKNGPGQVLEASLTEVSPPTLHNGLCFLELQHIPVPPEKHRLFGAVASPVDVIAAVGSSDSFDYRTPWIAGQLSLTPV